MEAPVSVIISAENTFVIKRKEQQPIEIRYPLPERVTEEQISYFGAVVESHIHRWQRQVPRFSHDQFGAAVLDFVRMYGGDLA
jgi:hypothetical protein